MRTYFDRYTYPNTLYELKAFFWGMIEFRSALTRRYGYPVNEVYDTGRDVMHALTFRLFEE